MIPGLYLEPRSWLCVNRWSFHSTTYTMAAPSSISHKPLFLLLAVYCLASLVHFVHNAEFLSAYPGLPESWTRMGVYLVWAGITSVGALGWYLLRKGKRKAGLLVCAIYAGFGLDSLAHYIVAPMGAHTFAMNTTILLEVGAACLVLVAVIWQFMRPVRLAA